MTRRTHEARIANLEAQTARLKMEKDRRTSVASDPTCALMYDAEKALRALGAYMGTEGGVEHVKAAETLRLLREQRWASIKSKRSE